MKIGVVTTSYPRWPGDSAGSFVEGHVHALRRLGHEVEVVAAGDGEGRVASPLFYRGGAPDALERSPRALLSAAMFLPRFTAAILRRARHWDQIIAHWLPSALAALPARKPLTAIAHGGDVFTLKRLGLLGPTLRLLRNARLVYVAEHLGTGIVQPMGLDLAHFRALGRAPASPPIVLVVARLVEIKGVDIAIEAMAHLPGMQLVIAGDGPERRALEARARHAPVTFLGEVDTKTRDGLLRTASVVAVPSRVMPNGRREGCPTIALEALAAGVPVVATIGRACELVPPDDPRALARGIAQVLSHPQNIYERVGDLDWIDVAQRLLRNE
jgi:glycosyltransferase involved in cell wall biosynthesis